MDNPQQPSANEPADHSWRDGDSAAEICDSPRWCPTTGLWLTALPAPTSISTERAGSLLYDWPDHFTLSDSREVGWRRDGRGVQG